MIVHSNRSTGRTLFACIALLLSPTFYRFGYYESSGGIRLAQAQPVIHSTVECSSNILDGGFYTPVTDSLALHWKLDGDTNESLNAVVEYTGTGWVGLGFSKSGGMVDSVAVIGVPSGVGLYSLTSKDINGVAKISPTASNIAKSLTGYFNQANGRTTVGFSLTFTDQDFPSTEGLYKLIMAAGETNELGYHRHRAAFQLDLRTCGGTGTSTTYSSSSTTGQVYDHRAAFAAHGFFATLAFAIVIPFAVAAAWFRTLMPKWWIYIHVLSNTMAFFFTMLAVGIAFGGMIMRNQDSVGTHMSKAHHWVGLVLFLCIIFQVANGFKRPPVEAKMDVMAGPASNVMNYAEPKRLWCAGQRTPREKWHLAHRITAIITLALAIFQLQSGMRLFAQEYNNSYDSQTLKFFWIWLICLVVAFVLMKIFVFVRERKHKQNDLIPRNIMPQRDEDDDNEQSIMETREFANVI